MYPSGAARGPILRPRVEFHHEAQVNKEMMSRRSKGSERNLGCGGAGASLCSGALGEGQASVEESIATVSYVSGYHLGLSTQLQPKPSVIGGQPKAKTVCRRKR